MLIVVTVVFLAALSAVKARKLKRRPRPAVAIGRAAFATHIVSSRWRCH